MKNWLINHETATSGRGLGLSIFQTMAIVPQSRTSKALLPAKSGLEASSELRIEQIDYHGMKWVNIKRPGPDEVNWLQHNYAFDPLHLEDITGRLQRPKIDEFEEAYLFLVLHFPVYNKAKKVSHAEEVDIFLGENYLITVHDGKLRPLERLFEQCKGNPGRRHGLMSRTPSFLLYKVIDVLVDYCFPIVNKIGENLEELDDKIFTSTSQHTIYEISTIRRDIMMVRRILKPQISVLASLERRKRVIDDDELEGYFADITDHIGKIWDSLEEYKEAIEGLSATYDSLTSHRLNQIIKALTMMSVVLMPMTLITGMYGMNVPLPFQEEVHSFYGILISMVVIVGLMLSFFRWRKWL